MPAETLQWPVCHRDESGVFHSPHGLDTSHRELGLQRRDPTPAKMVPPQLVHSLTLTVIAQEGVNMSCCFLNLPPDINRRRKPCRSRSF